MVWAMHSTNYVNTFIAVAEDTTAHCGTQPKPGAVPTVAQLQHALLHDKPYLLTSDEVLFQVHVKRQGVAEAELDAAHAAFFAKGQPCFRASPLTKTHGWGVHFDALGRMALVGMETEAYQCHVNDPNLKQLKAMRAARKA